jgi:hypothetical protein
MGERRSDVSSTTRLLMFGFVIGVAAAFVLGLVDGTTPVTRGDLAKTICGLLLFLAVATRHRNEDQT